MRILNVTVLLDPVWGGGTAERTYQMSKAFIKQGCECTILTTDVGLNNERIASLKGVNVVALPCIFKRFFVVTFSFKQIKKLVSNVDIIHFMGHWNMLNVVIYFFAKRLAKPYVICPAGELTLFGRSIFIKKLFNTIIGKKIIRDASGYIVVTPDEIAAFEKYHVKRDRVVVIPNGINEADFIPTEPPLFASRLGIEGYPFILFMGRLNLIKGPDLLLKAFINVFEKISNYHLVFAGPDGGMLSELQKVASHSGIANRIHFVGYVKGVDKANAYKEADLLVIPSRQEAMSIVVLEAGVLSTPVLLTDQCGFDEIEKKNGGLVVEVTVPSLEQGLLKLLSEPLILKTMGENLKEYVIQNYTWELIAKKYLVFFQQVVNVSKATHQE